MHHISFLLPAITVILISSLQPTLASPLTAPVPISLNTTTTTTTTLPL